MKAQNLLLQWITTLGAVRYARIKLACDSINDRYNLELDKPTNYLFFPLFKSGVIDICGNNKYARTAKFEWTNWVRTITNESGQDNQETGITGLYFKSDFELDSLFNGSSVLSNVPDVEKIVKSFPVGIIDVSQVDKTIGVVEEPNKLFNRYFIDNRKNLIVKIPSFDENPDAISFAKMYENILCEHFSYYDRGTEELKIYKYGIPIIIYRVLLIESLLSGKIPDEDGEFVVFFGIDKKTAKEVNRIQLKTLKYE